MRQQTKHKHCVARYLRKCPISNQRIIKWQFSDAKRKKLACVQKLVSEYLKFFAVGVPNFNAVSDNTEVVFEAIIFNF